MKITRNICACLLVSLLVSCTKKDEYKKFVEGGEIIYTGKVDSLKVSSGYNRAGLSWLLIADPKVARTKIYWNNRRDSMDVTVNRSQGVDTFHVVVENLPEGTYFFELFNFDKEGRPSVVSQKSGKTYGERYEAFLLNRGVVRSFAMQMGPDIQGVQIFWNDHIATETNIMLGTELSYTDATGTDQTLYVPAVVPPPGQETPPTMITNFKLVGETKNITYRSLYLPDKNAIDTFYTRPSTLTLN